MATGEDDIDDDNDDDGDDANNGGEDKASVPVARLRLASLVASMAFVAQLVVHEARSAWQP